MEKSPEKSQKIMPRKTELAILVAVAVILLLLAFLPRSKGASVTVTINGEAVGHYSLLQEKRLPLEGYGGYCLELVIEGGTARVENAGCPDLICQNHAAIDSAGEEIVCLPARIVISVDKETVEEEEMFDAVVG